MVGGELAWRLTGRWHCRCEIRDFGLFSDVHR
jgi:hypothetical protein